MSKYQEAASLFDPCKRPKRYRYICNAAYIAAMLVYYAPFLKTIYSFFVKHELHVSFTSEEEYRVLYLKFPFMKRLVEWSAGEKECMESFLREFQDFELKE